MANGNAPFLTALNGTLTQVPALAGAMPANLRGALRLDQAAYASSAADAFIGVDDGLPVQALASQIRPASFFGIRSVEQGVTTDQRAALMVAFQSGYIFDGEGGTFNVANDIDVTSNFKGIINAKFVSLNNNPTASSRVLDITSQSNFIIRNVHIDGGEFYVGNHTYNSNAALLWCLGCNDFQILDCLVERGGPGSGFNIDNCYNFNVSRCVARDMHFKDLSTTNNVINGFLFTNGCRYFTVNQCRSYNMDGVSPFVTRRFTQGFVFGGGCHDWNMTGCIAYDVDQTYDISTSAGLHDFEISNCHAYNSYTWGFKFANCIRKGRISNCVSVSAGLGGFVISASNNVGVSVDLLTSDLGFSNCLAVNPGGNADTTAFPIATGFRNGFAILAPLPQYEEYLKNITFTNCEAIDDQAVNTMQYGFYNGVPHNGKPENATSPDIPFRRNALNGCKAYGYTTAFQVGFHFARCIVVGTNVQSFANAASLTSWSSVDLEENATVVNDIALSEDTCNMHNASSNRDRYTIMESGFYEIDYRVEFAANATGLRGIRLAVISGTDLATKYENNVGASGATVVQLRWAGRLVAGKIIATSALQQSGGNLDVVRANSRVSISKIEKY